MKLRTINVVALILCLALVVMACNSNNGGTPSKNTPSPNTSGKKDPTTPEKKHKISYLGVAYGAVFPADGKGIPLINERFNVEYSPLFIPDGEYSDKLTNMVAANDMPDIASLGSNGNNYVQWAKQGGLLALDDYIKNDPELQKVPESIWSQLRVDGKIYGIPKYFPINVTQTPVIRKDWLDNLGLKMPTNYEELKQVAIAFTKDDPDGNGQNDTVGISISSYPDVPMGAYWMPWHYYPTEQGNFIPNIISPARKQVVQFLSELYQEGAFDRDFATKAGADVWMDFWSGKAGIFQMQPYQPGTQGFDTLLAKHPNAEVVAIPPFKAPDGSEGYYGGKGWFSLTIFNAKLEKDPDKVNKIFEMLKVGRQFIPMAERTPSNAEFDWLYGKEGEGYTIVDGKVVDKYGEGFMPREYLPDSTPWASSAAELELEKEYAIPQLSAAITSLMDMRNKTKTYMDPYHYVRDADYNEKWYAVDGFEGLMVTEQVRIITGQRPISDWDQIVKEWENAGAKALYERFDKQIGEAGITADNVWQ